MRESEIGESVKFKIFLLEIECLRLGFTFSKPSLRNSRSTWNLATRQAETEPQRLDFGPGNRASEEIGRAHV